MDGKVGGGELKTLIPRLRSDPSGVNPFHAPLWIVLVFMVTCDPSNSNLKYLRISLKKGHVDVSLFSYLCLENCSIVFKFSIHDLKSYNQDRLYVAGLLVASVYAWITKSGM